MGPMSTLRNAAVSAKDTDVDRRRRVGRAWRQLRRGASALRLKDLFYGPGPDGLDIALADALIVISQQGPMRMGELADALQITPASTTRAVGYQRSILVSATGSGRRRYEIINAKIQDGLSEILMEFTPEEQEQLVDYLERFVRSVDRFVESETAVEHAVLNVD